MPPLKTKAPQIKAPKTKAARGPRRAKSPAASPSLDLPGDLRGRILRAAFAAFMERGYAGASTLEIATRAKVSKREVYAQFGSKQAMLVACIGLGVQQIKLPLDLPAARDRAGLVAMLESFGANFLRVMLSPRLIAFYRLALAEAERAPEVAQTLDSAGRGGARDALSATIAAAQKAGLVGGDDPLIVTERFFTLLLGMWQLRMLLGVMAMPSAAAIEERAASTTAAILTLFPPRG